MERSDAELVLLEPLLGPADVSALSNEAIAARLDSLFRVRAAADGRIVELMGEVGRRESYRDEGATSTEPWAVERFGVSQPTARAYTHVAERAWDLPHLTAGLCEGELSFDKVRALTDVATSETDRELRNRASECSVRELADLARLRRLSDSDGGPVELRAERDYELRSLRFNEQFRTITAQLPPDSYVEARAYLEAAAREIPSDGDTPWDQRLCDGFLQRLKTTAVGGCEDVEIRGGAVVASPYFVVAHVPLAALLDESGERSELAGELERGDLVSVETLRRIACDASVTIAIDDDAGHTMYEGRARREPTGAQHREIRRRDRHCRFPGCANVTFTNVHHIKPWKPDGRTDLDNLVLLCVHHHHTVHTRKWTMSGNANDELTFVGPSGRVMSSRPSPLWTAVTDGRTRRMGGPSASADGA
jgi:hypothetical protein